MIRGFSLFLIFCIMSATSSPIALQRAFLISERDLELLEDLPDLLLRPAQDSERRSQALAWHCQA